MFHKYMLAVSIILVAICVYAAWNSIDMSDLVETQRACMAAKDNC